MGSCVLSLVSFHACQREVYVSMHLHSCVVKKKRVLHVNHRVSNVYTETYFLQYLMFLAMRTHTKGILKRIMCWLCNHTLYVPSVVSSVVVGEVTWPLKYQSTDFCTEATSYIAVATATISRGVFGRPAPRVHRVRAALDSPHWLSAGRRSLHEDHASAERGI